MRIKKNNARRPPRAPGGGVMRVGAPRAVGGNGGKDASTASQPQYFELISPTSDLSNPSQWKQRPGQPGPPQQQSGVVLSRRQRRRISKVVVRKKKEQQQPSSPRRRHSSTSLVRPHQLLFTFEPPPPADGDKESHESPDEVVSEDDLFVDEEEPEPVVAVEKPSPRGRTRRRSSRSRRRSSGMSSPAMILQVATAPTEEEEEEEENVVVQDEEPELSEQQEESPNVEELATPPPRRSHARVSSGAAVPTRTTSSSVPFRRVLRLKMRKARLLWSACWQETMDNCAQAVLSQPPTRDAEPVEQQQQKQDDQQPVDQVPARARRKNSKRGSSVPRQIAFVRSSDDGEEEEEEVPDEAAVPVVPQFEPVWKEPADILSKKQPVATVEENPVLTKTVVPVVAATATVEQPSPSDPPARRPFIAPAASSPTSTVQVLFDDRSRSIAMTSSESTATSSPSDSSVYQLPTTPIGAVNRRTRGVQVDLSMDKAPQQSSPPITSPSSRAPTPPPDSPFDEQAQDDVDDGAMSKSSKSSVAGSGSMTTATTVVAPTANKENVEKPGQVPVARLSQGSTKSFSVSKHSMTPHQQGRRHTFAHGCAPEATTQQAPSSLQRRVEQSIQQQIDAQVVANNTSSLSLSDRARQNIKDRRKSSQGSSSSIPNVHRGRQSYPPSRMLQKDASTQVNRGLRSQSLPPQRRPGHTSTSVSGTVRGRQSTSTTTVPVLLQLAGWKEPPPPVVSQQPVYQRRSHSLPPGSRRLSSVSENKETTMPVLLQLAGWDKENVSKSSKVPPFSRGRKSFPFSLPTSVPTRRRQLEPPKPVVVSKYQRSISSENPTTRGRSSLPVPKKPRHSVTTHRPRAKSAPAPPHRRVTTQSRQKTFTSAAPSKKESVPVLLKLAGWKEEPKPATTAKNNTSSELPILLRVAGWEDRFPRPSTTTSSDDVPLKTVLIPQQPSRKPASDARANMRSRVRSSSFDYKKKTQSMDSEVETHPELKATAAKILSRSLRSKETQDDLAIPTSTATILQQTYSVADTCNSFDYGQPKAHAETRNEATPKSHRLALLYSNKQLNALSDERLLMENTSTNSYPLSVPWRNAEPLSSPPPKDSVAPSSNTGVSPSLMSIDSQLSPSAVTKDPLVSDQAIANAAFLFASPSQQEAHLPKPQPQRDHGSLLSTLESRCRVSAGSLSTHSKPVTIPISTNTTLGEPSREESSAPSALDHSRRVRFSSADQVIAISAKKADRPEASTSRSRRPMFDKPDAVEIPAIETKMSDLTDTHGQERDSMSSTISIVGVDSSPVEEHVLPPTNPSVVSNDSDQLESNASSQQPAMTWSYHKDENSITAVDDGVTPVRGGKPSQYATNSPFLRFQQAKSRFSSTEDTLSTEQSRPETATQELIEKEEEVAVPGNSVLARVAAMEGRAGMKRPTRTRRDTTGSNVLAPHKAKLVSPAMLRNRRPAPKASVDDSIGHELQNVDASDSCDTEPESVVTFADIEQANPILEESSYATSGTLDGLLKGHQAAVEEHSSVGSTDDDEEDEFAALLNNNGPDASEEDSTVVTVDDTVSTVVQQQRESLLGMKRLSYGENSTQFSNASSTVVAARTVATGPERRQSSMVSNGSGSLSNVMERETAGKLLLFRKEAPVKPSEQNHHHVATGALFLSPLQRTPMQARKWRVLAAAAQEKDSAKKSGAGKKTNKTKHGRKSLSERSINVL